ncbi:hypothetical protein ACHAW6_009667 [Cyclotella cf. meneghiniana]
MPTAFENYLDHLGLPPGILLAVSDTYKAMNSRIVLIDNSVAMTTADSHLLKADCNFERIQKSDNVSRWNELSQCVKFHAKMAARCWIPTKFKFVNKHEGIPPDLGICWGKPGDVGTEREEVINTMKNVKLDANINLLARQIREIERALSGEADKLKQKDEIVAVIICTHGVPTDENGDTVKAVIKDFVESLMSLAQLPVKVSFRLCTGNNKVVDFFGLMEAEIACDVLQDYWGEATKVYSHNPWFTYGIGIHRLREAALGTKLISKLNKKALSVEEIRDFCQELFGGQSHIPLRNPRVDFNGFIEDLKSMVEHENLVWNPIRNKLCHWIDVNKLHATYQQNATNFNERAGKNAIMRGTASNPISSAFEGETFSTSRTMKNSKCSLMPGIADQDIARAPDPPEVFKLNLSSPYARQTNCKVTKVNPIKVSFNEGCFSSLREAINIPLCPRRDIEKIAAMTTDLSAMSKHQISHTASSNAKPKVDAHHHFLASFQTCTLSSVHTGKQATDPLLASSHIEESDIDANERQQNHHRR